MARNASLKLASAMLMGLVALPMTAWAAITTLPVISSSTHTENVSSTASDIAVSWSAAVSDNVGDAITYEFLFDTTSSYLPSTFQTAFDANSDQSVVPFNGTLTDVTTRTFDDVVDGTYYYHLRAYDNDGPLSGIVTFGPLVLNSTPTLNSTPVSPATGSHVNAISITISGSRFMSGATAELFGPTDVSGETAATVTLNSVSVGDANTITAQVPADIIPGTYDVKVTNAAPFNQAITAADAFVSTNTAPTAAAGDDQTLDLPGGGSVNINLDGGSSSDVDGDTIASYTWNVLQAPSGAAVAVGQTFTGSPQSISVATTGFYQFGLIVNDGFTDSAQDTVDVTVQSTASNNPPVASAGSDQSVLAGASVTLDASGSTDSIDNDPLTYSWAFDSVPTGSTAAFDSSTSQTPLFTADLAGTYSITVTVSDGTDSDTDTVVITANNNPPVADAGGNLLTVIGGTVSPDASGSSDPDSTDTLTYSWAFTSVPSGSGVAFDSSTSETPSFTADLAGTYSITLTVSDGTDSDTDTLTVSVSAVSLDVDGDGDADANDGVMIQRRLTGAGTVTTNISLPTSVGGSGASGARSNAEVVAIIDGASTNYDVDGDNDADANDGVLIQRRLTGAGTVTTNISLPIGVGGAGTDGARTNSEVVAAISAMTP